MAYVTRVSSSKIDSKFFEIHIFLFACKEINTIVNTSTFYFQNVVCWKSGHRPWPWPGGPCLRPLRQTSATWPQHVPKHGTMLCADPCHPGILQCFLASHFCEHAALTSPWHMLHMTPTSPWPEPVPNMAHGGLNMASTLVPFPLPLWPVAGCQAAFQSTPNSPQNLPIRPSGLVMAEDSGSARSAARTRRRAGAMAAGPPRMSREVSLGRNRWKLPTVSRNMTYQWKPKKHDLLNGKITKKKHRGSLYHIISKGTWQKLERMFRFKWEKK